MSGSAHPQARTTQITVKPLADELLVYDLDTNQASCLNRTASAVFKYCDGTRDVAALASAVSQELATPIEPTVVWYALKQLSDKNLLQTHVTPPTEYGRLTRRDFIKGAAVVGVGVAIPVIVSLSAPKTADAASCLATGQPCTGNSQCCSNNCIANTICA